MYFFINSALNKQNSGIEHAQLQRAKVFDKYKLPYKLVYVSYNVQFERWRRRFNVKRDNTINLFDYYQNANDVKMKKIVPDDIFMADVATQYQVDPNHANCYLVLQGKSIMGRIHWFDDKKLDHKQVSMVERFDIHGNLYRVDEYDYRGFLSRSQLYTPDNKIYAFVYFDINGRPVINQSFKQNAKGELIPSNWEIIDRIHDNLHENEGCHYYYETFRDLVIKFLNDLNDDYWSNDKPNYFVGDRMEGYEDALMNLQRPAIKIAHLHNSHGADVHDEMHSLLNNYYEYDLYNNDRYNFIIAATHKQANDVCQRFNLSTNKVRTIPVGLTTKTTQVPMNKRKPHSILVTARRAEEKQIDKMIEAIGKARVKVPDITMDVYGYRDSRNHDAAKKKIDKMIKKYDLKDAIHINNYDPNLDKQRDSHQVYMVFSTMEGFNIALMEAQNHGEVGISNDVNYGPNELVQNGENGYVVGYDDVDAAADKLVKLFTNDDLLNSMSKKSYELSTRYSYEAIYNDWLSLSLEAEKFWKQLPKSDIATEGLEDITNKNQKEAILKKQRQDENNMVDNLKLNLQKEISEEIVEYKQYEKGNK